MKKKILIILVGIGITFGLGYPLANANSSEYTSWIERLSTPIAKSTNAKIKGWVMSNAEDKSIKLYIDNQEQKNIEREIRSDVISAHGKKYGGEDINPKPGFVMTFDSTKLTVGVHEVKLEIIDNKTGNIIGEKKNKFTVEDYQYTSWIERLSTPIAKSTSAKIKGWVMSNAEDKSIKLYIDNQEQKNIEREIRSDVISAHGKKYGGEDINPKPGFVMTFDSTKLTVGVHEVKLEIIDNKTGNIIGEEKNKFTVEDYQYTSWIERLSTPIAKSTNAKIKGWVMSNAEDKSIKLYIDNQEQKNIEREIRPDVISAHGKKYGGEDINPKPGFVMTFDSTKLTVGSHEVKLEIIDNKTGNIIGTEKNTFTVEKHKYQGWIQDLSKTVEKSEKAKIKGWMMTTAKYKDIKIYIDDREQTNITAISRPDVIDQILGYGGIEANPKPGYEVTFDSTKLTVGVHKIKIQIIDTLTGEVIGNQTGEFKVGNYDYKMWLETPNSQKVVKTSLNVRGWFMSLAKDKKVVMYVDNKEIQVGTEARPDVVDQVLGYGGIKTNPTPGFKATYDTSHLKDGSHHLKIDVVDNQTGDIIKSTTTKFTVKKYDGMLYFENFSNSLYTKEINVRGWEMSELDGSYIETYIDNVKIPHTNTKEARPDVIAAYGSKYGYEDVNPMPGFNIKMSLGIVGQGVHTFRVKLYTKLNEEIYTYTKKIMVYKDLSLGIDVSQFNGSIDWTKVKRDSIDFAMIRLGYRGYGTGGLVTDKNFEMNVKNAHNAGVKVGVYFFSQAVNAAEGKQEADYAVDMIQSKGLTAYTKLPIVIDTEKSTSPTGNGRADHISKAQRTAAIKAFADRIKQRGYVPMIYASASWLNDDLDMRQLENVKVWLAHWTYSIDKRSNYPGIYEMWQYSNSGSISGINGAVDRNVSFIIY